MRSMEKSNLAKVSDLTSSDGIQSSTPQPGLRLVDLGVKVSGGWSAGKTLVENSIGGLGELSFGEFYINGFALPSIDIYYDNPVKSRLAESMNIGGREFHYYKALKLIYTETDEIPDDIELKNLKAAFGFEDSGQVLAVTSPVSLVAAIYRCSQAAPLLLEQLLKRGLAEEEILWAWATVPMPPLADDKRIMAGRMETALTFGTVISFWVRTEDEKIKEIIGDMASCGELRVHNLRTGRTFVHGSVDRMKLQEVFHVYT